MNCRIRKRHLVVWLILAVLLPIVFIISIAFRHSEPLNENIPKKDMTADERTGDRSF